MEQTFHHRMRQVIRWGDLDALGHVNNSRYFTYLESARLDYLSQVGGWDGEARPSGQGPILVHIACDFHQELRFPGTIEVLTRVREIRNRSFVMGQEIWMIGAERPAATSSSVMAWVDYPAGRAIPLPENLRNTISDFEAGLHH